MCADIVAVRAQFPALQRNHNGFPVAYFDGPGGTQVPWAVGEAMTQYLYRHNANTHWNYPTSHETDRMLAGARQALADFLGATAEEIAFGANMTTITFHLARALGRRWQAGDEVIVTQLDHHANVAPWQAIARERGVVLRTVRMLPDSGQLDWADLEKAFTPRTRLLAIGAASNALGTINDVQRATELAQPRRGALVRGRGALRTPLAGGCPRHRLRFPGLFGVQVLRAPYRRAVRSGGAAQRARLCRSWIRLRTRPRSGWSSGPRIMRALWVAGAAVDFLAALGGGKQPAGSRLASAMHSLHDRSTQLVPRPLGRAPFPQARPGSLAPRRPRRVRRP
jgi:hypothetical protein